MPLIDDSSPLVRLRRAGALATAAALWLMLLSASPAAAAAPTVERFTWALDLQGEVCPSGVSYDVHIDVREIDRDYGSRFVAHFNMDGEAVADNGVVVTIHHVWTETVDLEAGTVTAVGIVTGNRVIGTSVRHIERGRIVVDLGTGQVLWSAGKNDFESFNPHLITCDLIDQAGA